MARLAYLGLVVFGLLIEGIASAQTPEGPRATSKIVVEQETLGYEAQYEFSRQLRPGSLKELVDGAPGQIVRHYEVVTVDGKEVSRTLVKVERIEPVHAVFVMGPTPNQASRGAFTRGRVLTMESTAYTPSAGRGSRATARTATGRRAEFGVVAVDPRVIPLGTFVFVEGYGFAIAADTGGAIKGNKIDVCIESHDRAMQWGRRKVRVHILRRASDLSESDLETPSTQAPPATPEPNSGS